MAEQEKAKSKVRLVVESFMNMSLNPHQRRLEVHDKDPNYQYRLVGNTPDRIAYRQEMGYEVVTDDQVKTSSLKQADNRKIIAGKYVLMRRPNEIAEAHEAALRRKADEARVGPMESFKSKARRLGVDTEDKSKFMRAPMSAVIGEGDDD